jgi:putative peptide modification system cyclase
MSSLSAINDSATVLRTLVVCDLTDSTGLVERIGDHAAAQLLRRHDAAARAAIQAAGGQEIDKTDGFLVLFDRPIHGLVFAVDYMQQVRLIAQDTNIALNARVGIHVGEVIVWRNSAADIAKGAKPLEVEGLAKPVAARLMSLALPGQILISETAQDLARRADVGRLDANDPVQWLMHGTYRLKGLSQPMVIYEVGVAGTAPLRPPADCQAGWRTSPWWQSRGSLVGAATALIVLLTAALYFAGLSERALAFSQRDWVVIGDVVNVNADRALAGIVGTTFRLGMEQSRYINVLPESEIRQTLSRMQRDRATFVDREVASEIALREHARAVLMPSIAQYGGKLRVTAELVDPHSARTVLIRTADAADPNEALPAIDRVLRDVRASLGESLSAIDLSSQPLEKVATTNLLALQSLSRALEAAQQGNLDQSANLLVYATELDPEFATAYARLGSVLFSQQRYGEAHDALDKALAIQGRLTDREHLYVRAMAARFTDPKSMLDMWRTYADLYPDYGTGQNNLGNIYYEFMLDYTNAEKAFLEAAKTRSPLHHFRLQVLGYVCLAEDKLELAEQDFRAGLALSPTPLLFGLSDVLVALGNMDGAARYLDKTPQQPPQVEVERTMRRATLLIVRGRLEEADSAIETALQQAKGMRAPNAAWRARAALIAIRTAIGNHASAAQLATQQLHEVAQATADPVSYPEAIEELLYATAWAARLGAVEESRSALHLAERLGALDQFPVRAQLFDIARGELDLQEGHANAVADRLASSKAIDLWERHELRSRALAAAGDLDGEMVELRWITSHKGLAYGEWIDQLLGQQARAIALRNADLRLSGQGRRAGGSSFTA